MSIYIRCPHCGQLTVNKETGVCVRAEAERKMRGTVQS